MVAELEGSVGVDVPAVGKEAKRGLGTPTATVVAGERAMCN